MAGELFTLPFACFLFLLLQLNATIPKLLRSLTFESKVIPGEGWCGQGNVCVQQPFCVLVTRKDINCDFSGP